MYRKLFPGRKWNSFVKKLLDKVQTEPVLLTGLPQVGLTSFIKYFVTVYEKQKPSKSIILEIELLPEQNTQEILSNKLKKQMNYKLGFPKYLQELDIEEALNELIRRGFKILIILKRVDVLKPSPNTQLFLQTLRSINSLKTRFLISCDVSSLTSPDLYKSLGSLASANLWVLRPHERVEIGKSLDSYKTLYKWKIPKKFSKDIYELSGGFCGLIKYISKFIHEKKPNQLRENELVKYPSINYKLKDIITTLKREELIKDNTFNEKKTEILKKIGVLKRNGDIRIKLIKVFLGEKKESSKPDDLKKIFSTQEYNLYRLFTTNPETIVTLDEIAQVLWGEDANSKYSLWSMYKVISNLKKKLKPLGFVIKNYRGRGYQLTNE